MDEKMEQGMESEVQEEGQEIDVGGLWDEEDVAGQAEDQRLGEESGEEEGKTSSQYADKPGEVGGETSAQDAGEEQGEPVKEEGEEAEDKTSPQSESFTLRHLDDPPVTVDRVGVVRLAQQGLDYERVRTERDQLRTYREQADPALNVLKAFAEKSGMSLEEYVDYCRIQTIMEGGVDEHTAKAQVEVEKQKVQMDAQQRAGQEARQRQEAQRRRQQERAQAQRKDMEAFLAAYPEVKAVDVPREVWEKVAAGESLVSAFSMYQNQQLKARIAAMEKNRENAGKAPGSMKSQGEKGRKSLAEYWDEEE